jgi:hypothetical protein
VTWISHVPSPLGTSFVPPVKITLHFVATRTLILRKEHTLQVTEIKVLREMFGPREMKYVGNGGYYTVRSFVIYTGHLVLLQQTHKGGYDRLNIYFMYGKHKIIQNFGWETPWKSVTYNTKDIGE